MAKVSGKENFLIVLIRKKDKQQDLMMSVFMKKDMKSTQVKRTFLVLCPFRVFLILPIIFVNTSESPDRDCCEPLYAFTSTELPMQNSSKF